MNTVQSNDFDYGGIRITPNIQDRINQMHLRRAEDRAARHEQIAIESHREKVRAMIEVDQYRKANAALLCQIHAAMGWPVRVMLPAPEVM